MESIDAVWRLLDSTVWNSGESTVKNELFHSCSTQKVKWGRLHTYDKEKIVSNSNSKPTRLVSWLVKVVAK